MTKNVAQRLIAAMEAEGIEVYRYPNNRTIYQLLANHGLMERESIIKDVCTQLILPDNVCLTILNRRHGSQHRVYIRCDCQREIPYGRLCQHTCTKGK